MTNGGSISQCNPAIANLSLFRTIPEDLDFRTQWNNLVQAMESPEVFYTWEWAYAACRAYRSSLKPMVFAAFRDGFLIGIAALNWDEYNYVSFLTAATADYCDFISKPEDRAEFVASVFKELKRIGTQELRLANLPADSCSIPALRMAAKTNGYKLFSRPAYLCSQVVLRSDEDRVQASNLARRRSKNATKKLTSLGKVAVVHCGCREPATAELPKLTAAHVSRFLAEYRLSNLICSKRRHFLAELATVLSQQKWLTISMVQVDGNTIAWNYGMTFAGKWFWYQPAFDIKRQNGEPGTYLLCDIIRSASQNPEIQSVDLGLGDEPYKQRYSKTGRQTVFVTAASSPTGLGWNISRYYAATLIKKSPRLENTIRKTVSRISALAEQTAREGILHSIRRVGRLFSSKIETTFLEWAGPCTPRINTSSSSQVLGAPTLHPLSLEILAKAAMEYDNDRDTLNFLVRCAMRLNSGQAEGFVLMASEDTPLHFCWSKPFADCWISGVGRKLPDPAPESVLIFDCWTPASRRGRGHYQRCISMVASTLLQRGARPWIFTDPLNLSSLRGIELAGFVARFSVVRRKILLFNWVSHVEISGDPVGTNLGLHPAA